MRYENVEWQAAACKGINFKMFFIEDAGDARETNPHLRRICKDCPIYAECLEYALENEHHGFWGGLTATERKQMRGRMRRAA